MLFYPDISLHRVEDITPDLLKEHQITALVLDVDNTLTTHNNPDVSPQVLAWLDSMRAQDIRMILLSNNSASRVTPFAQALGLDFVARGNKPLASGFRRCRKKLGLPKENMAIVGDQLFTDILGGRLFGCKTILVDILESEDTAFFRFKRRVEARLLKGYRGRREEQ
jgi:HAD superfamily phosphatase (TIGR01668 family)